MNFLKKLKKIFSPPGPQLAFKIISPFPHPSSTLFPFSILRYVPLQQRAYGDENYLILMQMELLCLLPYSTHYFPYLYGTKACVHMWKFFRSINFWNMDPHERDVFGVLFVYELYIYWNLLSACVTGTLKERKGKISLWEEILVEALGFGSKFKFILKY